MASVSTNRFNDTLVTAGPDGIALPEGLLISADRKVVFLGYKCCPYDPELVGPLIQVTSAKYGPMYATRAAREVWPLIIDDEMQGGCCVTLVQDQGREFVVLVQAHGRNYLTNPVGGCQYGETHLDAAIRETREETGLKLRRLTLVPLATWTFHSKFGGLSWKQRTCGFVGYATKPHDWDLSEDINKVEYTDPDGEIDHLLVVDTQALDRVLSSSLHRDLIKHALGVRDDPIGVYPYLDTLEFH